MGERVGVKAALRIPYGNQQMVNDTKSLRGFAEYESYLKLNN